MNNNLHIITPLPPQENFPINPIKCIWKRKADSSLTKWCDIAGGRRKRGEEREELKVKRTQSQVNRDIFHPFLLKKKNACTQWQYQEEKSNWDCSKSVGQRDLGLPDRVGKRITTWLWTCATNLGFSTFVTRCSSLIFSFNSYICNIGHFISLLFKTCYTFFQCNSESIKYWEHTMAKALGR